MTDERAKGRRHVMTKTLRWLFFMGLFLGLVVLPLWRIRQHGRAGEQRMERLILETDYEALLEACRELARRVAEGELEAREYNVRIDPDPEASSFPQVILDLEPTYVNIMDHGSVKIELYGAAHHYGATGFPEGWTFGPSGKGGDLELIPGLWYHDTDYDQYPRDRKAIEAFVEKGRVRNRARREAAQR